MENHVRVKETWELNDTIRILGPGNVPASPITALPQTPGWVRTFSQLADQNQLNFFDQRNRSVGLMWCNLDARDSLPYGFLARKIGVRFTAATMTQLIKAGQPRGNDFGFKWDDVSAQIFVIDLLRECSLSLNVSQDEKLKSVCHLLPSGKGIYGDGYGSGQSFKLGTPEIPEKGEPLVSEVLPIDGPITHYDSMCNGIPELRNQFDWPIEIEIPKGCNLNVTLTFTEHAKEVLRALNLGWRNTFIPTYIEGDRTYIGNEAAINVCLTGYRFVQQRGELSR